MNYACPKRGKSLTIAAIRSGEDWPIEKIPNDLENLLCVLGYFLPVVKTDFLNLLNLPKDYQMSQKRPGV